MSHYTALFGPTGKRTLSAIEKTFGADYALSNMQDIRGKSNMGKRLFCARLWKNHQPARKLSEAVSSGA